MSKYKYLLKNIGLLTLSSFATKLLTFFLVPLYTNILTTEEYGSYDLVSTTIGVLLPVLTLNIQESVFRYSMDETFDRKAILSVSAKYVLRSTGIVIAGLMINSIFGLNALIKDYAVYFFLMFFIQALSGIVLYYVRGTGHIADLSISSVILTLFIAGCNFLFLVVFRMKLSGYFLANIIGPIIQTAYLAVRTGMLKKIDLKGGYKKEKTIMVAYSKPLIANSVAWWFNNASDKYIVTLFCGISENGIYSVAGKIPQILNVIQSIFAQAWTLSAVREFDPEDRNGFFTNTYKTYHCILVVGCSAIIAADKFLAKLLYAKDFYMAWKYVPWLTVAILFGALNGYLGGFFSAVKNSKIFAVSTMLGAVSNIVLNFILIPIIGALGAAIATAVSYFIVWVVRYIQSKKFIKLKVNIYRDFLAYVILIVQSVILLCISGEALMYSLECGLFMLIVVLYCRDVFMVINNILKRQCGK